MPDRDLAIITLSRLLLGELRATNLHHACNIGECMQAPGSAQQDRMCIENKICGDCERSQQDRQTEAREPQIGDAIPFELVDQIANSAHRADRELVPPVIRDDFIGPLAIL